MKNKQKYMTGEELKRVLKFIRNDAIISINGDPNIKIVDMESYETLAGYIVNLNIPFVHHLTWQDIKRIVNIADDYIKFVEPTTTEQEYYEQVLKAFEEGKQ